MPHATALRRTAAPRGRRGDEIANQELAPDQIDTSREPPLICSVILTV